MKLKFLFSLLLNLILINNFVIATEVYNNNNIKINLYTKFISSCNLFYSNLQFTKINFITVKHNIKSEYKINNETSLFNTFKCQLNFDLKKNKINIKRFIDSNLIELKHKNLGSLSYGKNDNIFYDIKSWNNILPVFCNNNSIINNFISDNNNHMITYRSENILEKIDGLGKLNVALQYQKKNENNVKYKVESIYNYHKGNNYALSAIYNMNNNVTIGLSIMDNTLYKSNYINNIIKRRNNAYSFGLKYVTNNFYISSIYHRYFNFKDSIRNYDKTTNNISNIELVTRYKTNQRFLPFFSFLYSKNNINNFNRLLYKKYICIGTNYSINKYIYTYINYKINSLFKERVTNLNTYYKTSKNNILFGIICNLNFS